jgi:hypothetical protein
MNVENEDIMCKVNVESSALCNGTLDRLYGVLHTTGKTSKLTKILKIPGERGGEGGGAKTL